MKRKVFPRLSHMPLRRTEMPLEGRKQLKECEETGETLDSRGEPLLRPHSSNVDTPTESSRG